MTDCRSFTSTKPACTIPGRSAGFGREHARHLLQVGDRAVLTARHPNDLNRLSGMELGYEFAARKAVARGADFPAP